MRLPRRVPWESLAELEQVCGWIYADENDLDAKERAVNRLAAWKVSVPLPHALEAAHALLCAILQDANSGASSSSYLSLRMSYASAVIRLVNGLVDPLQLGAYARSIHSIAQQLGLPTWLVELRHAATHEDLPSLELLRDAAREAMAWLLNNYFLPTLNPTAPPTAPSVPLSPLAPLLKRYKALLKATTRDATLEVQFRKEITKSTRAIERWIAEAKLGAPSAPGAGAWDDASADEDGEDARERWALDRLADALLEKGVLVPLSKKKRIPADQTLAPPRSSTAIWAPLLTHLQTLHPTLSLRLAASIAAHLAHAQRADAIPADDFSAESASLSAPAADSGQQRADPSYDLCLAGWGRWLADTGACVGTDTGAEEAAELREGIVVHLVSVLGNGTPGSKAISALLQALCASRPQLAAALSILAQNPASASISQDPASTVAEMDARLSALLGGQATTSPSSSPPGALEPDIRTPARPGAELPAGWRRLAERDGWRPAPIGVYVNCP